MLSRSSLFLICCVLCILLLLPGNAHAFGAGNIASIAKIEGHNWRHGDIEDMLQGLAHLKGKKWTSIMIKRVYFGNWLRDYSQAVDVATLKGVQAETIRVLVWILSFMTFGYATGEFLVTSERLGVYRPEEHIDNPEDYADNIDARQYDQRLCPPVTPDELAVDPSTGMKNYIANEHGGWATSAGYIRFSFARSIHFGRMYTSGAGGSKGRDEDLFEAFRCLGQGLHCLEDFSAHSNYVELALHELGLRNVFPHVGTGTQMNLHGKFVFPLVTGVFGGVDFLHSVLGEAGDHVAQSEVDQANKAMNDAASQGNSRGPVSPETKASSLTDLLCKIPGTSGLCQEAVELQRSSDEKAAQNAQQQGGMNFAAPPKIDVQYTIGKIYPILEFRDKVVRAISSVIEKIPGLEKLIDTISERITLFVMGLLAPFIIPIINTVSAQLKTGSSTVVKASAKHQYGPWNDPTCTAPTHSLLSKDHFSNILNKPAGEIASEILRYAAPRIVYAWEHPEVPIDEVLNDILRAFHHPALRQPHVEIQQSMFRVVEKWAHSLPHGGASLNETLGSESVKHGKNHTNATDTGGGPGIGSLFSAIGQGKLPSLGGMMFGGPGSSREISEMGAERDAGQEPFASQPGFSYGSLASDTQHQPYAQPQQPYGDPPGGYPQQQQPYPATYDPAAAYHQGYQGQYQTQYGSQQYPVGGGADPSQQQPHYPPQPQPQNPQQGGYGYDGYGYGQGYGGAPQ